MTIAMHALDVMRSFLPEKHLVTRRDLWALARKYGQRWHLPEGESRCRELLSVKAWDPLIRRPIDRYEKEKYLGGLLITALLKSPYTAYDPMDPNTRIHRHRRDAIRLDVVSMQGPEYLRQQLATAADYMERHATLSRIPYVAGHTYPAMGNLAVGVGFRRMVVESWSQQVAAEAYLMHLAYCAVNGKAAEISYEASVPTVVCLPTEEFIERFRDPGARIIVPRQARASWSWAE